MVDEDCFSGDIDGLGTDTGETFLSCMETDHNLWSRSFHDECNIEGLDRSDFDWLNGGAMEIGGRLDDVEVTFAGAPGRCRFKGDDVFFWLASPFQALYLRYTFRGEELHIAMGGLLFENSRLSRTELEGHAYMGIDVNMEMARLIDRDYGRF